MLIEGQQIGPYILSKRIGRGGFGEVWLGLRGTSLLTTKVALKLPLDDQIDLDAVKQEAVLWEQASGHANVLPIIEANIYDEQVVIVSEYVPNGSLADVLKRNEVLPIDKAVEITLGILSGLEYLHSRNIIHRDLKPANILMQGETPRLVDFGISRAMRSTQTSASVNIKGTPPYMAPEAFDGKRNKLTDIWSVGVILHHLFAGKLPFPQQDITSMIGAIIGRPPEPLPTSVPAPIRKVVETALAKDPSKRFLTAAAMRTALRDAFGQSTSDSRPIVEEGPEILTAVRPKKRSTRKENVLAISFAFVVFILLLAGVLGIASLVMRNSALTSGSSNIDLANESKPSPKITLPDYSSASNASTNAFNSSANTLPITNNNIGYSTNSMSSDANYTDNAANATNTVTNTATAGRFPSNVTNANKPRVIRDVFSARRLLANDMLVATVDQAQKIHPNSQFEGNGCIPLSFLLQEQQVAREIYAGIYRCKMRGSILGLNRFDFNIRVVGEVVEQEGSFSRNILSIE